MMVLIFKTTISSKKHINKVASILASVSGVKKWNVDLDDCDRILRLEVADIPPAYIETLVSNAGFQCRELED